MSNFKDRKILVLLSGSIACFKSAQMISELVKSGAAVKTAATTSALKFVGTATLEGLTGSPCFSDVYQEGRQMDHIHLARWADLMIVAPATATTLGRCALGLAEDAVSSVVIANNFKRPVVFAPAMNSEMFTYPAVQMHLKTLQSFGAHTVNGESGPLACGEFGQGRMAEPVQILSECEKWLKQF